MINVCIYNTEDRATAVAVSRLPHSSHPPTSEELLPPLGQYMSMSVLLIRSSDLKVHEIKPPIVNQQRVIINSNVTSAIQVI